MSAPRALDEGGRALLRRIVESVAWRQLAAMNILGHCIKYVTRVESKLLVAEELDASLQRFRAVHTLYGELGWTDIVSAVRERLDGMPYPASRLEFGICRYLYDRSELVATRCYKDCTHPGFAAIARAYLESRRALVPEGDTVFVEYCSDPRNRAHAQQLFDRWLANVLHSFGRPGSPDDERAVQLGLRAKASEGMMVEFLEELEPYRGLCSLELHLPAELADLSFPGSA